MSKVELANKKKAEYLVALFTCVDLKQCGTCALRTWSDIDKADDEFASKKEIE